MSCFLVIIMLLIRIVLSGKYLIASPIYVFFFLINLSFSGLATERAWGGGNWKGRRLRAFSGEG